MDGIARLGICWERREWRFGLARKRSSLHGPFPARLDTSTSNLPEMSGSKMSVPLDRRGRTRYPPGAPPSQGIDRSLPTLKQRTDKLMKTIRTFSLVALVVLCSLATLAQSRDPKIIIRGVPGGAAPLVTF